MGARIGTVYASRALRGMPPDMDIPRGKTPILYCARFLPLLENDILNISEPFRATARAFPARP